MRRRSFALTIAAAVLSVTFAGQAAASQGAAPALPSVALDASGTTVSVTGTMTAATQPATTLWNDGTLAQDLLAFDYPYDPMLDLVEGSVEHALPGDPLTIRMKVAAAPETPAKPYQWYRWSFQLEELWYFVEFTYLQNGTSLGWQGTWYYCKLALGSSCVHGDTQPFPVSWDAASRTISGQVPLGALAAKQPDGTLDQDTMRPFSTQYRPESGYKFPVITLTHDRAPAFTPYELPIATVLLGIAPEGTNPAEVAFSRRATPTVTADSLDVPFAGSVSTDGLAPGIYTVFVKACFGPCTIEGYPLTISA